MASIDRYKERLSKMKEAYNLMLDNYEKCADMTADEYEVYIRDLNGLAHGIAAIKKNIRDLKWRN